VFRVGVLTLYLWNECDVEYCDGMSSATYVFFFVARLQRRAQ
jgi:hypothetical protein